MGVIVAVLGEEDELPLPQGSAPPGVVLRAPDQLPLEAALAEMGALLERSTYVLVPVTDAVPRERLLRLHTLRSVLESGRIVPIRTGLPPLANAVLARQLRQLSVYDFGPGVIASAARLFAHYIHTGAQLASVAKLDRVPVDLKSHLKGWAPGTQYAALASPQPVLLKLDAQAAARLPGPAFPTQLVYAGGQQVKTDWVVQSLAPAWGVRAVDRVHLPSDSVRWWGTSKLTEFAAFIADPAVLYQAVARVMRVQCPWCGVELIGEHCVLCDTPVVSAANHAVSDSVPHHSA
ncbi:hypothetical protein ACFQLX_03565 [Streptomyces polyrhachis]|uniref:Uncharacterized protein n=1 Tax=Streptomyces polyrhachis TaxID=1282885 RepID=A0ABW2G923_9ACTN